MPGMHGLRNAAGSVVSSLIDTPAMAHMIGLKAEAIESQQIVQVHPATVEFGRPNSVTEDNSS